MGPHNSNPFKAGGELLSDYTVTGKNQDLFITYLLHKKTGKEHLLRELTFNEERELIRNHQKLKVRKTLASDHLTLLQKSEERKEDNMCSHYYKIYTMWDYPNKSLSDEIKERDLQKKSFENREMWSILACSIMGLSALQEKDIRHECLTTRAILMQDGNVKVADPLAGGLQPNFECVFNNRTLRNVYLSPEQCEAIESQKPIINKNSYKNDVFTMGIILLECGLLERQDHCYLDQCSNINWSKLEANVLRFGHIYDEDLRKFLALMLEKDIRNRPDWLDLNRFVGKNMNQNTRSQRNLPKRDHYITRTVKSLLPRQESKGKNGSPNLPSPVAAPEPYSSKFYGITQEQINKKKEDRQKDNKSRQEIQVNRQDVNRSKTITSDTRPVEFRSTQVVSNQPVFTYGNQMSMAQTSLPSYQFDRNNYVSVGNQPYRSTSPVNPRVPALTIPNMPSLQLNQDIYQKSNTAYIPQAAKTQAVSFPTFRFNETNVTPIKVDYGVKGYQPVGMAKYDLQGLGKVTESNIPKQTFYASNIEKERNGTQQTSYSPLNFSQFVRPVHSVNYEVSKSSPGFMKEDHSFPMGVKMGKTGQMVEGNSTDSTTPQYVVEHFKVGSKYEGYKLNGVRHGKGKFYYQDGGYYDGEWNNNKMEGFGTLYYQSNHKAYEGEWVNDQFHGYGKLYNDTPVQFDQNFDFNSFDEIDEYWQFYEGNFEGDEKDGRGKLRFSNGEVFEGIFKKDMVEGEGTFYCLDHRKIHAIWRDNHLVTLLN